MDLGMILSSVISFLIGGGLVSLLTIRQQRRKIDSEVDMAQAQAQGSHLTNVKEIIEFYQDAFNDMQRLREKREIELDNKYKDLEEEFKNYRANSSKMIKELNNRVKALESENGKLKSLIAGRFKSLSDVIDTNSDSDDEV